MNQQRDPSFGLLIGIAFMMTLNNIVIIISALTIVFGSTNQVGATGQIEVVLFFIASILNLIAVTVDRKRKLLLIVRRTAIFGNSIYLLLAVQAMIEEAYMLSLICFVAAAINIAGIVFAPIWKYRQDMICPECDYDLRGLTSRGCPECGWERE